jgi:hypothetical protein
MTAPDAAGTPAEPEIKDFTIHREPIRFRIDDDEFAAPPLIGGYMMRKLSALHAELGNATALIGSDEEAVNRLMVAVAEMFKALLPGAGGKRFAERLLSDGNPGDPDEDPPVPPSPPVISLMDQAMPVLYWLLEKYGLRPTEPSSPSPDGSTDGQTDIPSDGTSSTAGASPTALTIETLTPATGLI